MSGEIIKRIQVVQKQLNERVVADKAYKFFRAQTPIRTGRARRSTSLSGSDIQALYPYAGRLDQGYSPQAPDGMSRPTDQFVKDYIKSVSKGS